MTESVLQLYPLPGREVQLEGLYLGHNLRNLAASAARPFIYSNYVTSLDGRIAVPHPTKPGMVVPQATANERDWRAFQELAVQADILLTTGRYLRDYADGRAQEILQVYDDPRFADLKDWRLAQGLSPQPDLALISASLDFPIPPGLTGEGRSVLVITTENADPERIKALEAQTGQVITAGGTGVSGQRLTQALVERGYNLIYNAAGPKVLHLLLADAVLDRLYLTLANRILGGQPFSSIVEGDLLVPPTDFRLQAAYLDPHALEGLGQLFTSYDRVPPTGN